MPRSHRMIHAIRSLVNEAVYDMGARYVLLDEMKKFPLEELPALDTALRHAVGEPKPQLRVWNAADLMFVCLVSSHYSGYVRAEAVELMCTSRFPEALPFLLLRSTDWVKPVREAAQEGVRQLIMPEHAGAFVDCLGLIERLAVVDRFSPFLKNSVERFLRDVKVAAALERGLQAKSIAVRRASYRLVEGNPAFEIARILAAAVKDQDVAIRRWAFTHSYASKSLQLSAVDDPYPAIRRLVFDELPPERFLFDRSPGLRRDSQRAVPRASALYRASVSESVTGVALLGLGETGTAEDGSDIAAFLCHTRARIRLAAIRAIRNLGCVPQFDDRLLAMLTDRRARVAREAASALLAARIHSPETVWIRSEKRVALIQLFSVAPKWVQLRIYLEALAESRLNYWLRKASHGYARLSEEERLELRKLLAAKSSQLPVQMVREITFAIDTAHS
ncbi:MAG: hypothetical protein HYX27_15940 [Acidobacteria bacterium]|nr:hypothetical protein [Acidobacteriota bacterium]